MSYLFRSVIWLTGFALVYFVFLQNEKYFKLNRIFLLTGLLVSFLFPLISIHYRVEIPVPDSASFTGPVGRLFSTVQVGTGGGQFNYKTVLILIYLAGISFMFFRLVGQIWGLYGMISGSVTEKTGPAKVIRNPEIPSSFSFFNYVFINTSAEEKGSAEILNHELVHISQKHWIDLLLSETLVLLQWMNPVAWKYYGFVRSNHEYLADEAVLRQTSDPAGYKAVLINQLLNSRVFSLSDSFGYSINKKRFEMMRDIIASPYRKMKILLIIPVVAIIFYAFATPRYQYTAAGENSPVSAGLTKDIIQKVKGLAVDEEGKGLPGVTVIVSGTSVGYITDNTGHFAWTGIPEGSFLVFSYPGYKTVVQKPDFKGGMKIMMVKDPDNESQDIKTRPFFDRPDLIAGPLIVIDGEVSEKGVSNIDPDNISSITVLKVKSATEKYGSKGENGVIVITTKKRAWKQSDEPFIVVEEMPRYPGGDVALFKFIHDNVRYPEEAKKKHIRGKVTVSFIINSHGDAEDVSVSMSVDPLLDAEAIRVAKMLKGFSPGKQNGVPVSVWYKIPVTIPPPGSENAD